MLKAGPEEEETGKCCSYCGLGLVGMAALKKHLGKLPSWYLSVFLTRVLNITHIWKNNHILGAANWFLLNP